MGRGNSREVSVEPAGANEAEAIEAMARQIWGVCYAELLSMEQIDYMLGWMYAPARIREEIEAQGVDYRWLKLGDEAVGFASFGPGESSGEVHLHKIYVRPECHRQGIGSAALALIEAELCAVGAKRFSLRVNRGNQGAIRAYEKNGFERAAEVCSDIGGGFVMDDYVMEKQLG